MPFKPICESRSGENLTKSTEYSAGPGHGHSTRGNSCCPAFGAWGNGSDGIQPIAGRAGHGPDGAGNGHIPDGENESRVPDGEGEGRVADRRRPPPAGPRAAHQYRRRPDHGADG